MTKYIARLNGKIVGRRTTKDRTYSHAVVIADYIPESSRRADLMEPRVCNWCGRLDLAQKLASGLHGVFRLVEIVPAETETALKVIS